MKSPTSSPLPGYETKDASVAVVLVTVGLLFVGVIASIAAAMGIYVARYGGASSAGPQQTSFKLGPGEQTGIARDYAGVQSDARQHLQTYGWANQKAGTVHIPIERAMDLLVIEGSKLKPPRADEQAKKP